jgi:triosephosphate isomerase
MPTPFLAGNWKMHGTRASARRLAEAVVAAAGPGVRVAVFPPFVHLAEVAAVLKGTPVALGAQDCFWETEGAFTGEVSPAMLADLGCRHVLLGHSERRHILGETDATVARKLRAALKAGLDPLLCVGETLAQREANRTEGILKAQMSQAISGLAAPDLARVTVAYEPVWAIGTGRVASPTQAREAHAILRATGAGTLTILYGGSVKPDNLAGLLAEPGIDGALVGGASLDAAAFGAMLKTAASRKEMTR